MVARRRTTLALAMVATALLVAAGGCTGGSEPESPSGSTSTQATVLGPTPQPEITGTARNGETLTGHAGAWGPGEVTLSYRWLRDGQPITGAVEATYELTQQDVSHSVALRVTGSKPGFESVEQDSAQVGPVLKATMHSAQPTVEGTPVFGKTLTVGDLDWGSEEVRFGYRWLRDGYAVAGATGRSYRLGAADLGSRMAVEVTGRLPGFDPARERSAATGPVRTAELDTSRPALDGVPRYFEWLTVPDPRWTPRPVTLSYRWLRDGVAMDGVTGPRYQLRGRDIGHRISVQVTGTKEGYTTARRSTPAVGPVTEGRLSPAPPPVISGTPAVGRYLSASAPGWGPVPVTFGWQWFRGDAPIDGATDSSYLLTVADLEQEITVRATGTAEFFAPRSRTSDATDAVGPGELTRTPTPLYSGIAQVGETVTALPREWGPGQVDLAYQWFREDRPIDGATKATYVAEPADVGHRLRVRVTGSRHGYRPASRMSGFTGVVAPGVLTPGLPTTTGAAVQGATLTAHGGSWGPGQVALAYRWFRDGVMVTKATDATYTLSGADVGHLVSVRVTGTKPGYTEADAWSATVGPVVARER